MDSEVDSDVRNTLQELVCRKAKPSDIVKASGDNTPSDESHAETYRTWPGAFESESGDQNIKESDRCTVQPTYSAYSKANTSVGDMLSQVISKKSDREDKEEKAKSEVRESVQKNIKLDLIGRLL